MTEMPNRQFWSDTALWGAVLLIVSFAVNIFDVRGTVLRAVLVVGFPGGGVYVKRYVERRRERRTARETSSGPEESV